MVRNVLALNRRAAFTFTALMAAGILASPQSSSALDPKLQPYASIQGVEKISLNLLKAGDEARSTNKRLGETFNRYMVQRDKQGNLLVEIVCTEVTDNLLKVIEKSGLNLVHSSEMFNRVTVSSNDANAIYGLASLDEVTMIRPVYGYATSGIFDAKQSGAKMPPDRPLDDWSGDARGGGQLAHGVVSGDPDLWDQGYLGQLVNADDDINQEQVNARIGIISDSFASDQTLPDLTPENGVGIAEIKFTAMAGQDYTVVVETPEPNVSFELTTNFTENVTLASSSDNAAPFCDAVVNLVEGQASGFTNRFAAEEEYPNSSCGTGDGFKLYGFNADIESEVIIRVRTDDFSPASISVRTTCDTANSEVACASSFDSLPGEDNVIANMINQATGDLPPSVIILKEGASSLFGDLINEGAAMGEVIHDIAPQAELGFHTALGGEATFAEGIYLLAGLIDNASDEIFGADIVVDDIIYFAEPMFQPGLVESAVNEAYERTGITYFSAAGNSANSALNEIYTDVSGGSDGIGYPDGNDLHRWASTGTGYLPITIDPGFNLMAVLQWNQPYSSLSSAGNGAQIDLDAYLLFEKGSNGFEEVYQDVVGDRYSINLQGRTGFPLGDPLEIISWTNDTGAPVTVYYAVNHVNGMKDGIPQNSHLPLELRVVFFESDGGIPGIINGAIAGDGINIDGIDPNNPNTGGSTIYGHATAQGAISVAAVNYFDSPLDPRLDTRFGPTNEIDPEPFSSQGGEIRKYFDARGGLLPEVLTSFEPDISAADAINTTFFPPFQLDFSVSDFDGDGAPNFFGTSAAAPSAAAVAALLLSVNNGLSNGEIIAALKNTAIDVKGLRAAPGTDNVSGVGLINAPAAVNYIIQNYGTTTGLQSPDKIVFSASEESFSGSGWTGETPPGFTSPSPTVGFNQMSLTATNTFNTLGWLKSPDFLLSPNQGVSPPYFLNGNPGLKSLVQLNTTIEGSNTFSSQASTFRTRMSSRTFQNSSVMVVTSAGAGRISPASGIPRAYDQFFELPPSEAGFNMYYDLLGFDNEGLTGNVKTINETKIKAYPAGTDSLTNSRQELLRIFSISDYGWSTGNASPAIQPVSGQRTEKGLQLGPAPSPFSLSFGFWDAPTGVFLEAGRVYAIKVRVSSNVPEELKQELPTFRIRAYTGSLELAQYLDINSVNEGANTPISNESVLYTLFFSAPPELTGEQLHMAFDYLYIPGEDASQTVTFETLNITSYQKPEIDIPIQNP